MPGAKNALLPSPPFRLWNVGACLKLEKTLATVWLENSVDGWMRLMTVLTTAMDGCIYKVTR